MICGKLKLTDINSTASVKNVKTSNKIPCKIFWAYGIAICAGHKLATPLLYEVFNEQ